MCLTLTLALALELQHARPEAHVLVLPLRERNFGELRGAWDACCRPDAHIYNPFGYFGLHSSALEASSRLPGCLTIRYNRGFVGYT